MSDYVGQFFAMMRMMANERRIPIGTDGVVVSGSWNKDNGTVDVLVGTTAAIAPSSFEGPLVLRNIQVQTPVIGMQAGPVGGERVVLQPSDSGYRAILEHGDDDSPGAPSGEHWYVNPTTQSGYKVKLGPVGSEGKGAVQVFTALGHQLALDDSLKSAKMSSAAGLFHKLDDAAGQITHFVNSTTQTVLTKLGEVSHVADKVGLGDRTAVIGTALNAVVAKTHTDTLLANVDTQMLTNFQVYTALLNSVGTMTNAQKAAALASLVGGFFGPTAKIAASSSVFTKL